MSANQVFVQALADACDRPVEVSPQLEATTLGAGLLAGLAVGTWSDLDDVAAHLVAPGGRRAVRPAGRAGPVAAGHGAGRPVVPGAERHQVLSDRARQRRVRLRARLRRSGGPGPSAGLALWRARPGWPRGRPSGRRPGCRGGSLRRPEITSPSAFASISARTFSR